MTACVTQILKRCRGFFFHSFKNIPVSAADVFSHFLALETSNETAQVAPFFGDFLVLPVFSPFHSHFRKS